MLLASVLLAVTLSACANLGEYVWVNDYRDSRPPAPANSYVLGVGDVIQVRVYNQEGMSAKTKIRPDGKISLPFLNDVQADGYTPNVLAEQLEARLKDYVNKPVVTVSVEEQRHIEVAVVGEVGKQGVLDLPGETGLLQVIAISGGLTDLAHPDRIFVIRNEAGRSTRVRFDYKQLLHAVPPASTFRLRQGDQLVVE